MTNKQGLISAVAAKMNLTKKDATEVVDTVIGEITNAIVLDGGVKLPGVGTFEVKETKARMGRNPQTGEELEIAASKKVSFKASSALKTAVKA